MELVKSIKEGPIYGIIDSGNRVRICVDLEECESFLLNITQTEAEKLGRNLLKLLERQGD